MSTDTAARTGAPTARPGRRGATSETHPTGGDAAAADRGGLSRAAIVERALELADVDGIEAVTIRGLAADLGVTPMALYWHVRNKDELLDAMGDRLFEGALPVTTAATPWHEQLTLIIDTLVERFRQHPGALSLAYRRVLANPNGLAITESALQLLHDAGFSPIRAASIAQAALHNAMILVADRPGGAASTEDAARTEAKRSTIATLSADRYPRLLESGAYLVSCADDADYYHSAITMFVAGVRATAPGNASPGQQPA